MFSNYDIGNRINSARDQRGMTLDEIAKAVGVTKSTIQRYEKGTISRIKLPVIESIARVLNVDPNWLIGNTDVPGSSKVSCPVSGEWTLTYNEQKLIQNYRDLNHEGKEKLLDYSEDLVSGGRYKREIDRFE